jgi:hypothetical protein
MKANTITSLITLVCCAALTLAASAAPIEFFKDLDMQNNRVMNVPAPTR